MNFAEWLMQEEDQRVLIIMRGVPGSGKSHKTQSLKGDTGIVFSTDDYFGKDDATYMKNFTQAERDGTLNKKLVDYHARNLKRTVQSMIWGLSPIIVDNTNIFRSHFEPYVKAAQQYGYTVRYEEPDNPMWRDYRAKRVPVDVAASHFAQTNRHGVPQGTIASWLRGFEEVS